MMIMKSARCSTFRRASAPIGTEASDSRNYATLAPAGAGTLNQEVVVMVKPQTEKQQRFMKLFQPAQPRLQRFVLAMTRDAERAKDIVSETILIAFQRFETLRHDEAFLSFLFTIATRVARRTAQRTTTVGLDAVEVKGLVDPATPADRLSFQLRDAAAPVLLPVAAQFH